MQKENSTLVLTPQTVAILLFRENAFFPLIPKLVRLTIQYNRHPKPTKLFHICENYWKFKKKKISLQKEKMIKSCGMGEWLPP